MKLITVGTGSKGNCYLLKRDNDRIIALDCGCPWKKVMVATNFMPTHIDFALVTHAHSDHSKYMGDFFKNGIDVYDPSNLTPKTVNKVGDVTFIPFEVPHDTTCYAYLIQLDGRKIIYMTDFGYCKYTFLSWSIDTWIIACNHIDLPDEDSPKYAHVVTGHSSLETVKGILSVNRHEALKNVILVHYNEGADTDAMLREVTEVVGDGVNVTIAKKGEEIVL